MVDMEIQTFSPVTNIGGIFIILVAYVVQVVVTSVIFGLLKAVNMIFRSNKVNSGSFEGGRIKRDSNFALDRLRSIQQR